MVDLHAFRSGPYLLTSSLLSNLCPPIQSSIMALPSIAQSSKMWSMGALLCSASPLSSAAIVGGGGGGGGGETASALHSCTLLLKFGIPVAARNRESHSLRLLGASRAELNSPEENCMTDGGRIEKSVQLCQQGEKTPDPAPEPLPSPPVDPSRIVKCSESRRSRQSFRINLPGYRPFLDFASSFRDLVDFTAPREKGDIRDVILMSFSFAVYVHISQKLVWLPCKAYQIPHVIRTALLELWSVERLSA